MSTKYKKLLQKLIVYVLLTCVAAAFIYPVLYVICGSLKTNMEMLAGGSLLPKSWQIQNYAEVWEKANFAQYTFNSLYICFFSTLGAVILSALTAYCLERCNFPGRKIIEKVYLATMFIALGSVTLRPLYLLAVEVNLQNSLWPIILITIGAQGTNVFLITKFIRGLPRELDEAAIIDGCGPFKIFSRVLLPLLKPILAVVALFQFRLSWNDYITSSVFTMTRPDLRPLTVGVVQLKYGASAAMEWHLMMAGAAVSILPMLLVYFACNKYFISGITEGSVKG
ncbi:MAG: carbohydrate ABC transporter permease [Oscillospiraceae bacterium]|nr:carbohydrate ABC transporter permease [Oscillospiraceae bacterium]